MNPSTVRWFVLGTGLLALVSVSVATMIGLRLHRTRIELANLKQDDTCPQPTGEARTP